MRDELTAAAAGSRGTVVLLSANPIHDTGGGQRSAQIALELLERDFAVVFVSHDDATETVDLALRYDQERLVQWSLAQAVEPSVREALLDSVRDGGMIVTQIPVGRWLTLLERASEEGVTTVYDCIDRWASELGRGWYRPSVEERVAKASSALTASAPTLVDHVERLTGRETKLLPNAFNARVFRDADPRRTSRPDDLPTGRRIALYVGALWGGWMDWTLVRDAAEAHPGTAFVFVGDHRGEGGAQPESCHFLGLRPQTSLPGYLAHADVGFLPWRVNAVTQATSPLKVYEFVASGLPVVAPDLEPLRDIPGVYRVDGQDAFIRALATADRDRLSEAEEEAMRRFSRRSSWARRVDELLELREGRRAPATGRVDAGAVISVVMPAYEHRDFVGEAVASVASQTLPAAELVVVDDGSSDGTADVVRDSGIDGLRLVRQSNRGAHHALNRAVRLSRGDWVAILNSDDVFRPERLERALGVVRETGAALVFGAVALVDADGGEVDPAHPIAAWYDGARRWARGRPLASVLKRHNIAVTTSNFFLHRELWARLGGFRAFRYVHDYDFLLRARDLCPGRVVYEPALDDVLYRVHGDNTIAEGRGADGGRGPADVERSEMLRIHRRPLERVRRSLAGWRSRRPLARRIAASGSLAPVVPGQGEVKLDARAETGLPARVGLGVEALGTGGLEEVVALLAQTFTALGVSVSVLCGRREGAVARRLRDAGIDVTSLGGRLGDAGAWARREGIDVVSSHFAPVEVVASLSRAGVRVIETVQNCYAWFSEGDWERERARLDHVSAVVAVSTLAGAYYGKHAGRAADAVIPNAVHPGRAAAVPRAFARKTLGIAPGVPVFAFVGRITEQKNPAGLVEAFAAARASIPDAVLILAGPGDGSVSLRELGRAHPDLFATGAVRHVRHLRHVGTVLSAAAAFVSAAFYEGWSVAASEALWCGRPVVLTETGGSGALVGPGGERGILVPNPSGDPLGVSPPRISRPSPEAWRECRDALAAGLVQVAAHRAEWADRREAIRAWARQAVGPVSMATRYLELLSTMVDPAATPSRRAGG
ncbi:MAG: glycosyltransferase [Longimicrobiales bacterium]|nr:glycosyltransferase [Longimicrobiales bacterium]